MYLKTPNPGARDFIEAIFSSDSEPSFFL